MTREALDAIRGVVTGIVAESEARLRANQDRAVESIAVDFSICALSLPAEWIR